MDDFLKSFPSGHASSAVFLTMYPLIYSLYSRLVRVNLTKRYKESSRLIWDVRLALMNGFNAFVIATVRASFIDATSTCFFCVHLLP